MPADYTCTRLIVAYLRGGRGEIWGLDPPFSFFFLVFGIFLIYNIYDVYLDKLIGKISQ